MSANAGGWHGSTRPAYRLYHLAWQALDWVYPPFCGGCEQPGARWCAACQDAAQVIGADICPVCGQQQADGLLCARCAKESPPVFGDSFMGGVSGYFTRSDSSPKI